jgi:hypothetical protein
MFAQRITLALLLIHHGQCAMQATAILFADKSMTSYGTLYLSQENVNKPVRIIGILSGLNVSSSHVSFVKRIVISMLNEFRHCLS